MNLPKPFATVVRYSNGSCSVSLTVDSLDIVSGTKLYTEAQLLAAVDEALREHRIAKVIDDIRTAEKGGICMHKNTKAVVGGRRCLDCEGFLA